MDIAHRCAIAAILALACSPSDAHAQVPTPFVIRDLFVLPRGQPGNYQPGPVTAFNGAGYFAAKSSVNGRELWRTDGTPEGTTLVRDLSPGTTDSSPDQLTVWNGTLYFAADDGIHGRELWRTDGTAAGTRMVADLNPGTLSSNPAALIPTPNALLFAAPSSTITSLSLCSAYDGTSVFAIRAQGACCATTGGCISTSFFECNAAHGLWRGVLQPCSANPCFSPVSLTCCLPDKTCTFVLSSTCAASGGTPNPPGATCGPCPDPAVAVCCTGITCSIAPPASCTGGGGSVFYITAACSPDPCQQSPRACCLSGGCFMVPFTTDCTARSGTLLSASITCTSGSYPSNCTTPSVVCCRNTGACSTMSASTCVSGLGFIQPPGVTCATATCYAPVSTNDNPTSGTPVPFGARTLIFANSSSAQARQLWITDGTQQGTTRLTSTLTSDTVPVGGVPILDGRLYFFASSTASPASSLWSTDGTPQGTGPVAALAGFSINSGYVGASGLLYFTSPDPNNPFLWRTDGTPAGTFQLVTSAQGSNAQDLTPFQNGILFTFRGLDNQRRWWFTDGTIAGTRIIGPTGDNVLASVSPVPVAVLGQSFLFPAGLMSTLPDLWISDGTTAGTHQVYPIPAADQSAHPGDPRNWTGLVPKTFSVAGGRVYFSGSDGHTTPVEQAILWSTDGTLDGTSIVAHITAATDNSLSELVAGSGDDLFFSAQSETQGIELFKTSGSAGSTAMVKDILPGPGDSTPSLLTYNNGLLLFSAKSPADPATSVLHRSDGTAEGTYPLGSAVPYCCTGSTATVLTPLADQVLYFETSPDSGVELWRSDGTPAGTHIVADLVPGPSNGVYPTWNLLGVYNGAAFFTGPDGVYRSDGTAVGTGIILPAPPNSPGTPGFFVPTPFGVFFSSWGGFWYSDGTAPNTRLVAPTADYDAESFAATPTQLFFRGYSAAAGWEPWVSDGTAAGTHMIADLTPGAAGGSADPYPAAFRTIGNLAYFITRLSNGTIVDRYVTDGTAAGTHTILTPADFSQTFIGWIQGADSIYIIGRTPDPSRYDLWRFTGSATDMVNLTAAENSPYTGYSFDPGTTVGPITYVSRSNNPYYKPLIYRTDGTPAGTYLIPPDAVAPSSQLQGRPLPYGNDIIIHTRSQQSTTPGHRIYRTHAPAPGYELAADIAPYDIQGDPVVVGSSIYFLGFSSLYGWQIFVSDGTPAGTHAAKPTNADLPSVTPTAIRTAGNLFYYNSGYDLYRSDGTPAGTSRLNHFTVNAALGSTADINGLLYFAGAMTDTGSELWSSDGTPAGTVLVAELTPGADSSGPASITNISGRLFFSATNLPEGTLFNGREPCISDGTAAGTRKITRLSPTVGGGSNPSLFTDLNGIAIFVAGTSTSGSEVYRSDGTAAGTWLLKDINPSTSTVAASAPKELTRADNYVFFSADDGVHGRELWRTDGTPAGTVMVRDIWVGAGGSGPANLVSAGGRLYFTAYTPETGIELWTSDGTPTGTFMLFEIIPGPSSANIRSLTRAGNRLYFLATVPPQAPSLWSFDWVGGGPILLCPADYNRADGLTVQDIFDFLNDWLSGASRADVNGSGQLDIQDIFDYLNLWLAGCH